MSAGCRSVAFGQKTVGKRCLLLFKQWMFSWEMLSRGDKDLPWSHRCAQGRWWGHCEECSGTFPCWSQSSHLWACHQTLCTCTATPGGMEVSNKTSALYVLNIIVSLGVFAFLLWIFQQFCLHPLHFGHRRRHLSLGTGWNCGASPQSCQTHSPAPLGTP